MNRRFLSRRQLLRGALAATAAIPLLDAERTRAQSAAYPKRFVVFYTPNGTLSSGWKPQGTETSFTLGPLMSPLEPFKSKMLIFSGINLGAVQNSNYGSEHARGVGALLTARPLLKGNFRSFMSTNAGWASGISLDQHLANTLNPPTPFKTLELGVQVRDAEVRGRISYKGADQPVPPREDPYDTFNQLFGAAAPPSMPGGNPELDRLRLLRRSVFDLLREDIAAVRATLGREDRVKLEAHLDAIRAIEGRLAAPSDMGATTVPAAPAGAACAAPSLGERIDLADDNNMPAISKLQLDLAAAALACDQTRIVTIQYSYAESEHLYPFLGLSRNHHDISHDWKEPGFTEYSKIHTWFAEQLAYFLGKLDGYQEGDRTLLDNTVVFWGTEIGESRLHALSDMPYALIGSAGGYFRTGRFMNYMANGASGRQHNDLLLSIAHAMGTEDTAFGEPGFSTGPLPGLV
ncbi:MAG: DUF1552 domain-containing protein [Pseudomonadota bacterium]|nr:MAG: hypothetical protein DIU78_06930 [Pseudomonadota bacterium]